MKYEITVVLWNFREQRIRFKPIILQSSSDSDSDEMYYIVISSWWKSTRFSEIQRYTFQINVIRHN